MGKEIERKFLVKGDDWRSAVPVSYSQGYLNRDKNRTVRVRIAGAKAFLTVKGVSTGCIRDEFEYDIPVTDAKELLEICEKPLIKKIRRVIIFEGNRWEIDEFLDENLGLTVAEIELVSENQIFKKPDWVAEEVTDNPDYYNSNLSKNPYSNW